MRSSTFLFGVVVMGSACGGKSEPVEVGLVPVEMSGIGDCVDPTPATTIASAYSVDDQGRFVFCRDGGEDCRSVEIATGEMNAYYPQISGAKYDQPGAVIEDDGQMLVCWGQLACLRKAPGPFERWLTVELAADGARVAGLSAGESDRRWITLLDRDLTTTSRFEVGPDATDLVWWEDGRFVVHAADGAATRGYLYAADGTARGVVGALGAARPLDLGHGPVELAPGSWAFLSRDGTALAVHDLETGDGVRVELGATDQPAGGADLTRADAGHVAVVLGGAHYGDVVVVDVAARGVRRWPAKHCEASP